MKVMWGKVVGILLILSGVLTMGYYSKCFGFYGEYYPPTILGIEISQNMFPILSGGQIVLGIIVFFTKFGEREDKTK